MSDLERKLSRAAAAIDWPDSDLAGRVTAQIEAAERPTSGRRWLKTAMAAAVIVLLVLATPAGRQAVADLLEVAGIRVGWGVEEVGPGTELDLGDEVSLGKAAERVPFRILVPFDAEIGEPDAVYHSAFPPGGAVHLVWKSGEALPAAGDTEVGLLYSQFRAPPGGFFVKSLPPEIGAETLTVRGSPGFWIEGAPHIIFYEDESGAQERVRLAANVLAWEEAGVTHRIETTLGLDETVELAESLTPLP